MYKTDTSQAFLYVSMGSDVVYIKPPDWWPEPVPEGHCLQLSKASMEPGRQPADGICSSWIGWRKRIPRGEQ